MPEPWWVEIKQACASGLSVVNGLHTPMASNPEVRELLKEGQWIWDVRFEPPGLPVGSGKAGELSCRRVLTVGTDMAIGKMSTSLELQKASLKRGLHSKFLATGQAGLMIARDGVPRDRRQKRGYLAPSVCVLVLSVIAARQTPTTAEKKAQLFPTLILLYR